MAVIQLNCFVFGDDPSRIFVIEIEDTKTVSALKEVIKDKKKPYFDRVPADSLDIYKVSIPIDAQLHDGLQDFQLKDDPGGGVHHLSVPVKRLKGVFEGLKDEHIHVIVKRPPTGE